MKVPAIAWRLILGPFLALGGAFWKMGVKPWRVWGWTYSESNNIPSPPQPNPQASASFERVAVLGEGFGEIPRSCDLLGGFIGPIHIPIPEEHFTF